jgi:DUF971 family protein
MNIQTTIDTAPWPLELRISADRRNLTVVYDTGERVTLSAELLRIESPSAEVQGHGPGQKKIVTGKKDVTIAEMEPIGAYAVRILFSDGHSSGYFTWAYLHALSQK